MGKLLALDLGEKRVGYAVSDPEGAVAFPRGVIAIQSKKKLLEQLRIIIQEECISKIILGVPLGEDNEETKRSRAIRHFGELLARTFMLPIEYVDEFGTSREATSKIPFRKDRRKKGSDDAIAAQIILQRYLDGLRNS